MADRSQRALADFASEAQEAIDALGRGAMELDPGRGEEPSPQAINAVFRAAHSLKGLATMAGVERMARIAHALEDLLDDVRMGRRRLDRSTADLLLEVPDVLSRIVAEESAGEPPGTGGDAARIVERLRAREARAPAPPAPADPLDAVALAPEVRRLLTEYEEHRLRASVGKGLGLFRIRVSCPLASFDRDLGALSDRLKGLGEVVSTLPSPDGPDPQAIAFELLFASGEEEGAIRRRAGAGAEVVPVPRRAAGAGSAPFSAGAPPATPAPQGAAPPAGGAAGEPPSLRSVSQSVRVDIRKLDRLMTVVGELVLVRSSLASLTERVKAQGADPALAAELHQASRALERRLAELQAGVLEVRMVPLEGIFDKLSRMVRKIAREVGKEIELEVSGGDVELDKLIVEDLSDPLMHLIRNAIDHAIEPPEVRASRGKPRAGRVRLSATQKGNHVQIVVEDDGGGVDEDRIRDVAVERGIVTAEAMRELSRREVLNLIFVPGFSTARAVTSMSGRGVGLDVVKNNIANLSGIIELRSERGSGTRFEITLPVTLAIVRALVVAASGRTYAVPLNSVLEIVEVRARDVRTLSTRELITLRGSTLPLVRLARLFDLPGAMEPESFYVVVVGLAQERLGIAVDDLLAQQDVVVKPLGPHLHGIRGVAGATDLGARRTVLVLDVAGIVEEAISGDALLEAAPFEPAPRTREA